MSRSINEVIEQTESLRGRDTRMYQQLVRSFRGMSKGGDGGQAEAWSLFTIRSEHYPGWSNEDFTAVLERLGET
jgi:hypothetical protein